MHGVQLLKNQLMVTELPIEDVKEGMAEEKEIVEEGLKETREEEETVEEETETVEEEKETVKEDGDGATEAEEEDKLLNMNIFIYLMKES